MTEARFPYEISQWHRGNTELHKRWLQALELTGTEGVRIRLAQFDCGSAGSIPIGTELDLVRGFAEEWLAWHDKQKAVREIEFRQQQIFWTRWAALAATTAATAAVVGWALTAYGHEGGSGHRFLIFLSGFKLCRPRNVMAA